MKLQTKTWVLSALIAAMYAGLTILSSLLGLAYGPIQFRISEALIMLAYFTPAAIPGLTVGCVLANLGSPYGVLDVVLGTLATFLATVVCYHLGKLYKNKAPFIYPLIVALFNSVIIGLEIAIFTPGNSFLIAFVTAAIEIGIGELTVCYVAGIPLFYLLKKHFKF